MLSKNFGSSVMTRGDEMSDYNTEYAIRFDPWPVTAAKSNAQFIERLRIDGRQPDCYTIGSWVVFSASGLRWRSELKRLSAHYAESRIELSGKSEVGEEWVAYAKGGRIAVHHRPDWVPPAFAESDLR